MASPFMAPLILFFLLLSMATHSNAAYCLCKDGASDQVLQKNIDYACGNGADCTPILQSGSCFNPNTVKDHCSWAVNSYYQRKAQSGATCSFGDTATLSQNPPSNVASTCPYQAGAGNAGTGATPTTGSPPTGTTPTTGSPPTGTGTGTGNGTGTGTGTGMGTGTPGMGTTIPVTNPGIGLAPGSGFGSTDSKASVTLQRASGLLLSTCLALLVSGSGQICSSL